MKLRLCLVAFAVLCVPAVSAAQTHPCDSDPASATNLKSPVNVAFCVSNLDEDGNSTVLTKFTVRIDGAVAFDGPLTAIGVPNAAGLRYYEVPGLVVARGGHSAVVTAWNIDGESLPSAPEAFGVVGGKPQKPTALRVQ
jgi:hypothetical protein